MCMNSKREKTFTSIIIIKNRANKSTIKIIEIEIINAIEDEIFENKTLIKRNKI